MKHYFLLYFFGTFSYFIAVVKNDNRGKIVGGLNVERDVWKFMVGVITKREKAKIKTINRCGGSILDACHILTAAHCV